MTVNDQHALMLEMAQRDAERLRVCIEDAREGLKAHQPGKRNRDAHALSLLNCTLLRAIGEATFAAQRITETVMIASKLREEDET